MSIKEMNKGYIAIHKAEFFNGAVKTLNKLMRELNDINNELNDNQDYDLDRFSIEVINEDLENSKHAIETLQYLMTIKRSNV